MTCLKHSRNKKKSPNEHSFSVNEFANLSKENVSLKRNFFSSLRASAWSKNKGSPEGPRAPYIRHWLVFFRYRCFEQTGTERKQRSPYTSAGCHSTCVLLATIWSFRRDSLSVLKLKFARPFSNALFSSSSMIHSLVFSSLIWWYSSDVIFSESIASFLR